MISENGAAVGLLVVSPDVALFVFTVLAVTVAVLLAIWSAHDLQAATRLLTSVAVVVVAVVVPAILAQRGALDRYNPLPAPALVMVGLISLGTLALTLSPIGRSIATNVGLAWLVGFQAFRIPVEWWLHRAYVTGLVPVEMTFGGRNFDIVSGVTGLLLGMWVAFGRPPRGVLMAWNLLGLALLANIVSIAVLAVPTPFQVFVNGPPNLLPSTFPYVWLPTLLVQAALAGHILVFRKLATTRRA